MARRLPLRILTGTVSCAAFLLLAGVPAAVAGGGGYGGAICRGLGDGTRISLLDNCFDATAHRLSTSDAFTVTNNGLEPHSYTSVDGFFDTGVLQPGASAEVAAPGTGTYPVYCSLHSSPEGEGMSGMLVVGPTGETTQGASSGVPLRPAAAAVGLGALLGAAVGHKGIRLGGRAGTMRLTGRR